MERELSRYQVGALVHVCVRVCLCVVYLHLRKYFVCACLSFFVVVWFGAFETFHLVIIKKYLKRWCVVMWVRLVPFLLELKTHWAIKFHKKTICNHNNNFSYAVFYVTQGRRPVLYARQHFFFFICVSFSFILAFRFTNLFNFNSFPSSSVTFVYSFIYLFIINMSISDHFCLAAIFISISVVRNVVFFLLPFVCVRFYFLE